MSKPKPKNQLSTPQRRQTKLNAQQTKKTQQTSENDINAVYRHWCSTMRPNKTRYPALDIKRYTKIGAAIHDYGIETCKQAINGCANSRYHMGDNPQRKRYDSIELIFRNQDNVERFTGYTETHTTLEEWGEWE